MVTRSESRGRARRARELGRFFAQAADVAEGRGGLAAEERRRVEEVIDAAWQAVTGHEVRVAAAMRLVDAIIHAADTVHIVREPGEHEESDVTDAVNSAMDIFSRDWPEQAERLDRDLMRSAVVAWAAGAEGRTTSRWKDTAAVLDAAGLHVARKGKLTNAKALSAAHIVWRSGGRGQLPWWPGSQGHKAAGRIAEIMSNLGAPARRSQNPGGLKKP